MGNSPLFLDDFLLQKTCKLIEVPRYLKIVLQWHAFFLDGKRRCRHGILALPLHRKPILNLPLNEPKLS